ncbi:Kelch repeat-containing protein [Paucibacter sp. B51]|uniref:Kelch repeat-containing protein n=1 Tax=Paucibacter sp. B51 TaxID=2993315 RepID=UPI0022EBFD01|nr:kelch repeat-containing protein [Paucibacter sp. B51]
MNRRQLNASALLWADSALWGAARAQAAPGAERGAEKGAEREAAAGERTRGWTRLPDMPLPLAKFGVAVLGGKIHVLGGYDTRRSVLVYDIASQQWSHGPELPRGTDNVAAIALADRLLAIGGEARLALQVLDAGRGQWSLAAALPRVSFASAATVLEGQVHVLGGWNYNNQNSASLDSHSVLDPSRMQWSSAAPLPLARNAAAAVTLGGQLYLLGGRAPGIRAHDQHSLARMDVYSPAEDRWSSAPPLPRARAGLAAVALDGRLYALGGEGPGGEVSAAMERYEPSRQTWTTLADMPYRSHGLGAVAAGGALYVMGGFGQPSDAVGSESAAFYRYRP